MKKPRKNKLGDVLPFCLLLTVCLYVVFSLLTIPFRYNDFVWYPHLDIAFQFLAFICACWLINFYFLAYRRPLGFFSDAYVALNKGKTDLHLEKKRYYSGDFNRMIDAYEESAKYTEDLQEMGRNVAALVSHELKTPITIIKGYCELLELPNLSDQKKSTYVRMIAEEAERLSELAVNMHRITSLGKNAEFQTAPVRIDEVLQRIVTQYEDAGKLKNIQYKIHTPEVICETSADLLSQVVINILDNAIKFLPEEGKIYLKCGQNADGAHIIIRDNGTGMDQEDIVHLFEPFYQNKNARQPGSGLGLAIVKRICDILDFTIDVKSEKDKGTIFTIFLYKK